jgi:hypothetical protein
MPDAEMRARFRVDEYASAARNAARSRAPAPIQRAEEEGRAAGTTAQRAAAALDKPREE